MTKDEARKILEDGESLEYHVWWYSKSGMNCSSECCGEIFKSVDEAINDLESACGGNWENVRELL